MKLRLPSRAEAVVMAALFFGTLLLYAPMWRADFINYDDTDYVTGNVMVQRGITWHGFLWAFSTGHAGNWHPLTWLAHMLNAEIFGRNAGGHHLVNVLLHALNSVLLFRVLKRLTGACWRSAVVAALFAWHPLHVESVAWVAELKDVLSTFFLMLTIWAYVKYVEQSKVQSPKSKVTGVSSVKCRGEERVVADHASRITHHVSRITIFYLLAIL